MILGGKLPGKVGRRRLFSIRPVGQAVKTSPFHGGNMGSIPVGVIDSFAMLIVRLSLNGAVAKW